MSVPARTVPAMPSRPTTSFRTHVPPVHSPPETPHPATSGHDRPDRPRPAVDSAPAVPAGPTSPEAPWKALSSALAAALLDLPPDGVVELLLPHAALGLSRPAPGRTLLSLVGAPASAAPALAVRGWGPRHDSWHHEAPEDVCADQVAVEAVEVVREALEARPGDVELWRPRSAPPPQDGSDADGLW